MHEKYFNSLSTQYLRFDFLGGLTSAVVALPLALAFGVSSGAGPSAGLYGAIFVGFFAALFGGTPRQISGPTGPMTVVMGGVFTALIAKYPESGLAMGFTAVILAGLLQIAMGLLRLGKYFTLVPFPVISGFMSGIGVIIIILQSGPILGHASASNLVISLKSLPEWITTLHWQAVALGVITLGIVYFWPKRLAAWCPGALAALIIGTITSLILFPAGVVSVIGSIPSGFPTPTWGGLPMEALPDILYGAVLLAMLGAIDSLLTSLVADNLTKEHHDSNKELVGQGIGNAVAGVFGGLPGAGATMRTVVNIRAGGKTGYSGAIHSVVLLGIMLGASQYAAHVPLAVLAGILIKVGSDIIDWKTLKNIRSLPLLTTSVMAGVLFMTVFVDLITAVLVGVFISNLITIDRLTKIQLDNVDLTDGDRNNSFMGSQDQARLNKQNGKIALLHLKGALSFGVGRGIRQKLSEFTQHETLIVDIDKATLVGTTTLKVIDEVIRDEKDFGRQVVVVGIDATTMSSLDKLGTIECIGKDKIFDSFDEAMSFLENATSSSQHHNAA